MSAYINYPDFASRNNMYINSIHKLQGWEDPSACSNAAREITMSPVRADTCRWLVPTPSIALHLNMYAANTCSLNLR